MNKKHFIIALAVLIVVLTVGSVLRVNDNQYRTLVTTAHAASGGEEDKRPQDGLNRPFIPAYEPRYNACRNWYIGGWDPTTGITCGVQAVMTANAEGTGTAAAATELALTGTPAPGTTPGATTPPPTVRISNTPRPTPSARNGNCGVGNGEDEDTPGCPGGANDGPGTGPGNPGRKPTPKVKPTKVPSYPNPKK